ncbi:uncharacterized protein LOC125940241 [Dermacentor silvarum]|uniref:uncharacterized protein LOC125940241 n=1 Tax=Dermacentor silvarum TaxID=543639 RepID=UPI002101B007|nr:uncharacterized protein LOC125940241 [Dermacentor silvarum]
MQGAHIIRTYLVAHILLQRYSASAESGASACLEPPTVEGCSLVRLKWSFNTQSRRCERNYVCSNHPNAFLDEASCMSTCPSVPRPQPPKTDGGCAYWLTRLGECKRTWLTSYRDNGGSEKTVFIYTECGSSPYKYYAYYVAEHRCAELRLRGGRRNQ